MGVYFFTCDLTLVMNDFAGLKEGILWAGIMIVVFLEIFLAVFFALAAAFLVFEPAPVLRGGGAVA